MTDSDRQKGEGDRESAKRYNEAAEEFVNSKRGREAIEDTEGRDDGKTEAEKEGESRAREVDPAVSRDYGRAGKKPGN